MKTHLLASIFVGALSAFGASDSDADVQYAQAQAQAKAQAQAQAQVAAIEPLLSAPFARTNELEIFLTETTRRIEVAYTIRPPMGAAELRQRIIALFSERGWAAAPPGQTSPRMVYPDGRVDYPLIFIRAKPEQIKDQYALYRAYIFFADDLATILCGYEFLYAK